MIGLLAENEGVEEERDDQEPADDLEGLFDDDNEQEEYKDGIEEDGRVEEKEDALSDLFGDVDDIEDEEKDTKGKEVRREACESLDRSKEDLQGLCQLSVSSKLPLVEAQRNLVQLLLFGFISGV